MTYSTIDAAIIDYLSTNKEGTRFEDLFSFAPILSECDRIAQGTGRDSFRVLDGRLQAIRRKKQIAYTTKSGWQISTLNQSC